MQFEIEKDIPVPESNHAKRKYPFPTLKKLESFFVPYMEAGINGMKVRSSAYYAAKKLKREFTVRAVDGGIRVWRTA